jgi:hypothetical protein
MKVVTRGTVQNGMITVHEPLPLPDGTKVTISLEVDEAKGAPVSEEQVTEFASLPFHGMWADREDMTDSVAWVREIRKQWRQRPTRQA